MTIHVAGASTENSFGSPLSGPNLNEIDGWQQYWSRLGQPWRTEAEIEVGRQEELQHYLKKPVNIELGHYPFKSMSNPLTRGDIEWLLAEKLANPELFVEDRLDLRGADLRKVHLNGLPLAGIIGGPIPEEWVLATDEQRDMAALHLEKADLRDTHLEGAILCGAYLKDAMLRNTHLERAILCGAHLGGAIMQGAHLEDADLREAHLEGTMYDQPAADLRGCHMSDATRLDDITLGNAKYGYAPLADVHWNGANLAVIDWSQVPKLGDEYVTRWKLPVEFLSAARANRQVAKELRAQGMNDYANHYMYRAHVNDLTLQRNRPILPVVLRIFVRERMPLPKVLMRIQERRQGVHVPAKPVQVALLHLIPVLLAFVALTVLMPWLPLALLVLLGAAAAYVFPTMRKRAKHPPVYQRAVEFVPPPGLQGQDERRDHQWQLLIGQLLGNTKADMLKALREPQKALKRLPSLYKMEKQGSGLAGIYSTLVVLLLLFDDSLVNYGKFAVMRLQHLLTGFGYKFGRTFGWYLVVLLGFAAIYTAILGQQLPQLLSWGGFWETLAFSFGQFHSLPTALVNEVLSSQFSWNLLFVARLIETVIGLVMEIGFVAAIVQRLYDK